jgi:hypothetical protein
MGLSRAQTKGRLSLVFIEMVYGAAVFLQFARGDVRNSSTSNESCLSLIER